MGDRAFGLSHPAQINDITNTVTRVNPIPDTDNLTVGQDALFWDVVDDLFLRLDPVSWFMSTAGALWAANDDLVGVHLQQFNHLDIDAAGNDFSRLLTSEDNSWRLNGKLEVQ
jgi:hypothetical protein